MKVIVIGSSPNEADWPAACAAAVEELRRASPAIRGTKTPKEVDHEKS